MNKRFVVLVFLSIVGFSSFSVNAASYIQIDGSPQELDLQQLKAPTLLVFWASWCSSCIAEMPHVNALNSEFSDLDLIGVNVNRNPEDGIAVQQQYNLNYPSIADPNLVLADKFKVRGTPGFILLDKNGEVRVKAKRLTKKLRRKITEAMAAHGAI